MNQILNLLPEEISCHIEDLPPSIVSKVEEIRIRIGRRLEIVANGTPYFPAQYKVSKKDGVYLLNKLSQYSIYAIEEELKQGYITIQGGHRVGLAGKVITENGRVKVIRDVTSFNIRVAREKIGVSEPLLSSLYDNGWCNTLIIGPPKSGKTTILRDLARVVSVGYKEQWIPSLKVGIVDERSEIAGCVKGIPQHDLGDRVDVLDGCPKAEGMMMLIRSMSPDVIIVDEIGRTEDAEAIMEAIHAGVSIVVTAHAYRMEDLLKRPSMKPLLESGVFHRIVELSNRNGAGTIEKIRNHLGEDINHKVRVSPS
jgi:stage III sporulation protein AA